MERYNNIKIGLISDTHIEFGPLTLKNNNDIDVLVLAGDIVVPGTWTANHSNTSRRKAEEQKEFLSNVDKEFSDIPKIQIMGNHEYYHSDITKAIDIIKEHAKSFNSAWHIGDNMLVKIKDYNFYASTLWTNNNNDNPIFLQGIKHMMNDYRLIKNHGQVLNPLETSYFHKNSMNFMTKNWEHGKKNIVISHHLPSFSVIDPKYKNDHDINYAYASNLDNWILDHKPLLWCCGHSHDFCDLMLGDTRIVRHPRGYINYEKHVDPNYNYKVIEV